MKWFKHYANCRDDKGLRELQERYGYHKAHSLWFMIIEEVCKEMDQTGEPEATMSVSEWCSKLRVNQLTLAQYSVTAEFALGLETVLDGSRLTLKIPNILKIRDNHTRNLQATNRKPPNRSKMLEVKKETKAKKVKILNSTDQDKQTAGFIFDKISKLYPQTKKPSVENWANEIRLAREYDHRTLADLEKVFDWANRDTFWRKIILSPANLRKNYDKIFAKMSENGHGGRVPGEVVL